MRLISKVATGGLVVLTFVGSGAILRSQTIECVVGQPLIGQTGGLQVHVQIGLPFRPNKDSVVAGRTEIKQTVNGRLLIPDSLGALVRINIYDITGRHTDEHLIHYTEGADRIHYICTGNFHGRGVFTAVCVSLLTGAVHKAVVWVDGC